jgi:hypothetical protein
MENKEHCKKIKKNDCGKDDVFDLVEKIPRD